MRTLSLLVLTFSSLSCTIHVHVHEDDQQAPTAVSSTSRAESSSTHGAVAASPSRAGEVRGIVVDAEGKPAKAHVALVGSSGSTSRSTGTGGEFMLEPWNSTTDFVLHASTPDGRVAVEHVVLGQEGVRLVLQRGAVLRVNSASTRHVRCALFLGDVRFQDFTLRANEGATVVVPAGDIRVRLYDGGEAQVERDLTLKPGDTQEIQLQLGA